jgi:hypothetical protein
MESNVRTRELNRFAVFRETVFPMEHHGGAVESASSIQINKSFLALVALLASLAACAALPAVAADATGEARVRAGIMPLFTAMQAAANVHDAEAHLAYFVRDPDLTFVANGAEIHGWDSLLAQQKKWWPGGKIAPTDEAHQPYRLAEGPSFQLFGPRLAMLTFVLDARRVYPDRVMRRPIAVSQLWEKRPEGWKIVYAHESLGPERPETQ